MTFPITLRAPPITLSLARVMARDLPLRVHENGFIQMDVNEYQRVHFWGHPDIPCQSKGSAIHDHVFSFDSVILKGVMTNILYREVPGDEFAVYGVADGRLVETGRRVSFMCVSDLSYHAGEAYHMRAHDIHEAEVIGPTVTVITKSTPFLGATLNGPRVYANDGVDNNFRRDAFDQGFLRQLVEEIVA